MAMTNCIKEWIARAIVKRDLGEVPDDFTNVIAVNEETGVRWSYSAATKKDGGLWRDFMLEGSIPDHLSMNQVRGAIRKQALRMGIVIK